MSRVPPLTEEQRRAVEEIHHSLAVDASAGSGKTRVLTERYLRLLDTGEAGVGEIVAITFTDAAAAEMRKRIRERVDGLIAAGERREHWEPIRWDLARPRIGTFHGFCLDLIRAHATRLGLSPDVRIADDFESGVLLRDGLRAWLDDRLRAGDANALSAVRDAGFLDAVDLLAGLFGARYLVSRFMAPEAGRYPLTARSVEAAIDAAAGAALRKYLDNPETHRLLDEMRAAAGSNPVDTFLVALRRFLDEHDMALTDDGALRQAARVAAARRALKINAGSKKDGTVKAAKAAVEAWRGIWDAAAGAFAGLFAGDDFADAAATAATVNRWLALHADSRAAMEESRRAAGWLDFEDQQILAWRLLSEHADIRRDVTRGIRALLVDEYQDTNPIQHDLLKLLKEGDGDGRQPVWFVVGDAKQSIYRFRGAEVAGFREVFARLPENRQLRIPRNYRSHPRLIGYFNMAFAGIFAAVDEGLDPEYLPVAAGRPGAGEHAGAPIVCLLSRAADPDAKPPRADRVDMEAGAIAGWLAGNPGGGTRAMLLRSFTHVQAYEEALRARGIDYVIAKGRGFFAQQEIRDAWIMLRLLAFPADRLAWLALLRMPVFGVSDAALDRVLIEKEDWAGALRRPPAGIAAGDRDRLARAVRWLDAGMAMARREPYHRVLRWALEESGYDLYLAAAGRSERPLGNLDKLGEQLRRLWDKGLASFADAVRYVQEQIQRESKESEAAAGDPGEALQIMTVHAAKGLEFDTVIIAGMDQPMQSGKRGIAAHPVFGPGVDVTDEATGRRLRNPLRLLMAEEARRGDLAEFRRLLYVAMTRARHRLVLSGYDTPPGPRQEKERMAGLTSWLTMVSRIHAWEDAGALERHGVVVLRNNELPAPAASGARRRAVVAEVPEESAALAATRAIPPPPPESMPVTTVADAMHCPRKVWLQRAGVSPVPGAAGSGGAGDAAEFGTAVHQLLQYVPIGRAGDDERWIDKVLAARRIDAARVAGWKPKLQAMLAAFRATPLAGRLRDAGAVMREAPFVIDVDGLRVSGAIDAMLRDGNGWEIVDFKTNADRPDLAEWLAAEYAPQMHWYQHAVTSLCGPVTRLTLYSTALGREIAVPPAAALPPAGGREALAALRAESFPARPEHCPRCVFQKRCHDGARLRGDAELGVPAS